MKVFISIPWFHPAYKAGGPIQSIANMVKQIGNKQCAMGNELPGPAAFKFKIFCGNKDLDGSLLTGVAFDKWVSYSDNTKVWYSSKNDLASIIKTEIKREAPDAMFITGIYSWRYNLKPLLYCGGVRKIVSVRGMLHPGALSQKRFKKKIYLQLWKLLGLHKKNVFHATDAEEKKYIRQIFGEETRVVVASNFPRQLPMLPAIEKKRGQLKLGTVALISPMKNILLILESLKSIVGSREPAEGDSSKLVVGSKQPAVEIEYNIYGPVKDKNYWQSCLDLINKMPNNIVVKYRADIPPAEIENALAQNHVFILPSRSENFGHAIYEALSAGKPVITSNETPWNDLEVAKAGMNVAINDTRELIVSIDHFVRMNKEELNTWSNGARKYAIGAIDFAAIGKQYESMFDPVTQEIEPGH